MNMTSDTPQSNSNVGLVFIAGAGLDAWVWQDTIAALGMPALAISFKEAKAGKSLTLNEYAQVALEQINGWSDADRFVIVGHSVGGVVALQLAGLLGDRVAGLVAVGSVVPKQGGSFFSSLPFPQKLIVPLITRMAGTRPPNSAIKKSYCNDLSEEQATAVLQDFQPESFALYNDKMTTPLPEVPRLYVKLLKDQELGLAPQDTMAKNLGATVTTLETGHLPMLAKPAELAGLLRNFAASC